MDQTRERRRRTGSVCVTFFSRGKKERPKSIIKDGAGSFTPSLTRCVSICWEERAPAIFRVVAAGGLERGTNWVATNFIKC